MEKEIIEQNGKKYIEYNQYKYEQKRTIINIVFLILLVLAIIGLLSGIVTLLKNKEMLQHEPLKYVMERYKMEACSCIDERGKEWYSGEEGWKPNLFGKTWIANFSGQNYSEELNIIN